MSQDEKDNAFNKMAKDLSAIKRWYPVALVLFGLIGFTIKANNYWNDNVATKQDINRVEVLINNLNQKVEELKNTKQNFVSIEKDSSFNVLNKSVKMLKTEVASLMNKKPRTYIILGRDPITNKPTQVVPIY